MTASGVVVLALAAFLLGVTVGYIAWGRLAHDLEDEIEHLNRLLDDEGEEPQLPPRQTPPPGRDTA